MNSKILKLYLPSQLVGEKLFNVFTEDKYGDWENTSASVTNQNAPATIRPNYMYTGFFGGHGQNHCPWTKSVRTFPSLRDAKSIAFTINIKQGTSVGWNWTVSWDVYFKLLNEYVKIRATRSAYNITIGDSVVVNLSMGVTYSVVLYQNYLTLGGTKYSYAQGNALKKAQGNLCEAYCYPGQVWSNDYSGTNISITLGNITVNW